MKNYIIYLWLGLVFICNMVITNKQNKKIAKLENYIAVFQKIDSLNEERIFSLEMESLGCFDLLQDSAIEDTAAINELKRIK